MKRIYILTGLLILFNTSFAQTSFEWTKRSSSFTHGVSGLVSYIDLGDISFWGYMEISLTGSFNNENTTGLYRKNYNIGTNLTSAFYSNTSEVAAAIGPVAAQWKLGEFQRDTAGHLIIPIYHLKASGNSITVQVKGITLSPINTSVFSITPPQVSTTIPARDFNYINGKLSIGTSKADTDALLTVGGNINSREIKVKVDSGADYVFDKDYKAPDLEEVEDYVKTNRHLQNIPSASEIVANGLEVGNFQIKLLQKIEELTLYLIEEHEKNRKQEDRIKVLEAKLEKINSDK